MSRLLTRSALKDQCVSRVVRNIYGRGVEQRPWLPHHYDKKGLPVKFDDRYCTIHRVKGRADNGEKVNFILQCHISGPEHDRNLFSWQCFRYVLRRDNGGRQADPCNFIFGVHQGEHDELITYVAPIRNVAYDLENQHEDVKFFYGVERIRKAVAVNHSYYSDHGRHELVKPKFIRRRRQKKEFLWYD